MRRRPARKYNDTRKYNDDWIIAGFLLTLLGGLLLPILPLWTGSVRVLAALIIVRMGQGVLPRFTRRAATYMGYASVALMLFAHGAAVLHTPFAYLHSVFMVSGLGYSLPVGALLAFFDFCFMLLLLCLCWSSSAGQKTVRIFIALLGLFAALYYITPLRDAVSLLMNRDPETQTRLQLECSALFNGNSWTLAGLMALILSGRAPIFCRDVLRTIVVAGTPIALVLIFQHIVGDFSYNVQNENIADYFFRAKASYYYHSPASLLVAASLLVTLGQCRTLLKPSVLALLCIGIQALALYLNGTRAINAGMVIACVTLAGAQCYVRAHRVLIAVTLAVAVLASTQIFYEKIVPPHSAPESAASEKLQHFTASNNARAELMQHGRETIGDHPWLGQGAGTVSIPLSGYLPRGELSTYSSHSFLIDTALAAGIPAMLALIALLLTPLCYIGARLAAMRNYRPQISEMALSLLPNLVFAACMTFFFPYERNFLIPLLFILLAVTVRLPVKIPDSALSGMRASYGKSFDGVMHGISSLLIFGMLGFTFLWSASVAMPIAELLARDDIHIGPEGKDGVYTNSRKLYWLSHHVLNGFAPNNLENMRLLEDNADTLPKDNAWIVWDAAYNADYPVLLKQLGYNDRNGKVSPSPAFPMPADWQLVDRLQQSVQIIRVGTVEHGGVPLYGDFARTALITDTHHARIDTLSDYQFNTVWSAPSVKEARLLLDNGNARRLLSAYAIFAGHQPDLDNLRKYSWKLEGSNDMQQWAAIDRRENIALPRYPDAEQLFTVASSAPYRYFRLVFIASAEAKEHPEKTVTISELRMYSKRPQPPVIVPEEE